MFILRANWQRVVQKGRSGMKRRSEIWKLGTGTVFLAVAWIGSSGAQESPAHSVPMWFATEVSIAPDPGRRL